MLLVPAGAKAGETDTPAIDKITDPAIRAAVNDAHNEMVVCLAFWSISVEGIRKRDPNSRAAHDIDVHSAALLEYALRLHHADVTTARYKLAVSALMSKMRRDFSNFSLLMDDFLEPCAVIGNDPAAYVKSLIR